MIRAKSTIQGVTRVFDSMLHMRTEEAFAWLQVLHARKEDPEDPTFTDHESPDFNPFKLMFKESPVFKGMPGESLMTVSLESNETDCRL